MPFSQNCGLIHQLCPLNSRGGQPNPCLPLALICHHIKPVSQQKPWRWPAIKILIWYLLLSPLDMQKYPHRCFSLSHWHKWMFWWVHTGLQMCPCAHTHTHTHAHTHTHTHMHRASGYLWQLIRWDQSLEVSSPDCLSVTLWILCV